jgi:hypothetical protein
MSTQFGLNPGSFPYNLPTVTVSGTSGSPNSLVSLTGFACVNIISPGLVTLQSASVILNQRVTILNSSGTFGVTVKLDSGTILGQSSIGLASGQIINAIGDGNGNLIALS